MPSDTIFALSSGRPPAAVSIIRISGAAAHRAGEALGGSLPPVRTHVVRKLVDPATGALLDQALMLRFDGPASATGEDIVELHCHGGRAVVAAVLTALAAQPGLREAEPGEFTRRAFALGRIDLTQAEGLADLIAAETEAQRKAALRIAGGGLRDVIEGWRERVVALSARAEQAIDYADEDGGGDDAGLRADCAVLAGDLRAWIARPRAEPLKDGVKVVVAGPPNAGKSSLVNAIAGYDRAIVSASPGTTRDHIEVPLALGGVPIVLTDTAGLRDSPDAVEAIGVARVAALIEGADVLLWLGDEPAPVHSVTLLAHARADLPGRVDVPAGRIAVSSLTGAGLPELLSAIQRAAEAVLPAADMISLNRRQADEVADANNSITATLQSLDLAVVADGLRQARHAFDRLTGRAGIDDLLDALFSRFCLGK
ncbi:MAG: tRNA uridine-5-carboxymethylaminomethyl(34) synthesis GTPase MnmE [Sphingomicrobium sp.]